MKRRSLVQVGIDALDRLDLPVEAAFGVPQIELTGQRQFFMAHHKGVLSYTTECIEIGGEDLLVRLTGRELQLLAMTEEELRVGGTIEKVELVT